MNNFQFIIHLYTMTAWRNFFLPPLQSTIHPYIFYNISILPFIYYFIFLQCFYFIFSTFSGSCTLINDSIPVSKYCSSLSKFIVTLFKSVLVCKIYQKIWNSYRDTLFIFQEYFLLISVTVFIYPKKHILLRGCKHWCKPFCWRGWKWGSTWWQNCWGCRLCWCLQTSGTTCIWQEAVS
jgi:hypothetical protein